MTDTPSAEKIAEHYASMMHSVELINGSKKSHVTDEEWTARIELNKEHLRTMVAKDYWTDEDMTAVNDAIGD
tara:strand:+ start:137 stop:352 length:216 start_codon:yes stop_codon:yes gene_type:complete